MRGRGALALYAVGWVVVAVAVGVVVWGVISRAGDGVTGGIDAIPSADRSAASTHSGTPDGSPSASSPGPTDTSSPASSAAPVDRTWQGSAGVVSAECRGATIRLTGASPTSGFAVEVDDDGPDRVRVEFDSEESRTRVEAACVAGVPAFTEDRDGED